MDNQIIQIQKDLEEIKKRNKSVELDKAWETSLTRKIFIALFTFLSISLYMWAIDIEKPFLNAIVPTIGFLLSTLTLPYIKKIWSKNR